MMNEGFTQILLAALAALLLAAAVSDLLTRRIPNWLSLGVAVMAPLFWWAAGLDFYPDALERMGVAYLIFLLFFGMFCLGGMGGGDVKLGAAVALWFPPILSAHFLIMTSLIGAVVTIVAWIHHKFIRKAEGKTKVPYGVAIAAAGLLILIQRFLNQFA